MEPFDLWWSRWQNVHQQWQRLSGSKISYQRAIRSVYLYKGNEKGQGDKYANNGIADETLHKLSSNTSTKNREWTRMPRRVGSSCSASDIRRFPLLKYPVISHKREQKDEKAVVICYTILYPELSFLLRYTVVQA
jgi:hypothetical protein